MTISKSGMKEILTNIMAQYSVIAPAYRPDGKVVEFLKISDPDTVITDDQTAYKSPKEFFFPSCEKLLSYGENEATAHLSNEKTIVFSVRPCDLEALATMAKVFATGTFGDPYFSARHENSLLIGVGCREKKPGCFCERLGVDMGYSNKCDLFLENTGDSYHVRYVSDKGRKQLSPYMDLEHFENIPIDHTHEYKTTTPNHVSLEKHTPHESNIAPENILSLPADTTKAFEEINWDAITETCIGCGLCTFICPTCHCFDFKDVKEGAADCRYRVWDSCMYPKFTLHASGHNPRPSKAERFRQRVLHKYVYVPQNVGETACTGCGRCVRSCPAGMNLPQIVTGIMEALS